MSIFYKAKCFIYEQHLKSYLKDERGVTAIEYAVLGVAVSAIMLALFTGEGTNLGSALEAAFAKITKNLEDAT
ncbi:fimbrial protein [Enterovibrio norvegicus]|uniref:Flp family type IVb pilin n=1 Tax=Enterovibrio norvegicus TaxID=188144 RepID=UPI000C85F352|nr:Flp family type IVb pilin [Enterovibrio norvegicus]MCC4797719.1 Flp family type IVb pilin [Enterovibrio norvegicus]PMH61022.1 fimbrial protein [Enterovibrio norvegicus]PMI32737.1 fimbrial protein [Enterovibrio norvegicus]PMI38809.1 fimbrial protein [Enterovibrio norvegicus]PMN45572.1 fimbrial protein [Enterovibrio norvegicus]